MGAHHLAVPPIRAWVADVLSSTKSAAPSHVRARDYIIIEGTLFVAVTKNKLQKTLNQI